MTTVDTWWILILLALFTKHFIVDFPLQAFPYQYRNKGTYGHAGGILHAWLHLIGTFLVLIWFTDTVIAVGLALVDSVIHYHIDWAKMKLNAYFKWSPTTHESFWILLGFDQYLHALTYFLLCYLLIIRLGLG